MQDFKYPKKYVKYQWIITINNNDKLIFINSEYQPRFKKFTNYHNIQDNIPNVSVVKDLRSVAGEINKC